MRISETLYVSETEGHYIFWADSSSIGQKKDHSFYQKSSEKNIFLHGEAITTCKCVQISLSCLETSTSNFCLSKVSFASFCGLLKVSFVPSETSFFLPVFQHSSLSSTRGSLVWMCLTQVQERAFPTPAPRKFHNVRDSLAYRLGAWKMLASPPAPASPPHISSLHVAPFPETPELPHCLASSLLT